MTAKKTAKKALPKARYKIVPISLPTLDDDAHELHNTACQAKLDTFFVMTQEGREAREYVAILANNYELVCHALAKAHELLKESNVVHAVDVARRIQGLEESIARIDRLERRRY